MVNSFLSLLILLLSSELSAASISFTEAVQNLAGHESVASLDNRGDAMKEEAGIKGSWGDPKFKIAAKNFPKDSLKDDESPMTGVEFGVSQKVALTTKYGKIEDAFISMSQALKYQAKNQRQLLTKSLWEVVIVRRKTLEEIKILKENINWITKILRVSKKLYANGKTSQQSILDIQIRKSELDSSLSNKMFEIAQLEDKLSYLMGHEGDKLDYSSIPWKVIDSSKKETNDFRQLALKEKVLAKEYSLTAAKMNYVPDLNIAIGYTSRSNIDGKGDFLGASITFPLPFSGTKYANHSKATQEKYGAQKEFKNYQRSKQRDSSILSKEIEKLKFEISIMEDKTIKYAKNSRTITSKSYSLGNSTYLELLQSELKLQKILLKKVMLIAKQDIKKITLKYVLGESLYE